jgi:methyltransferase-like protein
LICSAEFDLKPEITANRVCGLYASAFGDFKERPEFTDQPETYQSAKGIGITTASPAAKAALYVLAESWPERLSFVSIVDSVLELVEGQRDETESTIADLLLAASTTDGVELHGDKGNYTRTVEDRPVVSPLARYQAIEEDSVFSLRHTSFNVDPFSRILLTNLDGSRTAEDIVPFVVEAVEDGSLMISEGMSIPEDEGERNRLILDQVKQSLQLLADQGLFLKVE